MIDTTEQLIVEQLQDWRTGWSMGSFGAIAEFHWDSGEPNKKVDAALAHATNRGAIRFDPDELKYLQPVAYEIPSKKPARWSQAVALCIPETRNRFGGRSVLTYLGSDQDAILPENTSDQMFDMGLSLVNCDFCIRTGDAELIDILMAHKGRSLFEPDNPAMGAILKQHPHRVAITNAGRAEVFQKIGGPDTGGVSPMGPHTHVLPKLLKTGRTHSANTPIPDDLIPVANMHPGNPVIDETGNDRPFDPDLHSRFQDILDRYGSTQYNAFKVHIETLLTAENNPEIPPKTADRLQRAALKNCIRQHLHLAEHRNDRKLKATVTRWMAANERSEKSSEVEDDAPGH